MGFAGCDGGVALGVLGAVTDRKREPERIMDAKAKDFALFRPG